MANSGKYRFLFAGGGTGGHLFPAIAVAEKIKKLKPEADIIFVGTKGKIEATVVPAHGYKFKSIWIKGFSRKSAAENLLLPFRVAVSMIQSVVISMGFKPRVAIGSGGYVSGPAIWGASVMGAKILLMEQNSYPGITTKLLERKAAEIYLGFEDSKKYFRSEEKLKVIGNPVRESLNLNDKSKSVLEFGLSADKKTVLVLGGSLGAAMINRTIADNIQYFKSNGIQLIWQTGKNYFNEYKNLQQDGIWIGAFIDKMNVAYSACDLLITRAGATTIAEITALGIPAVLIPSPNVAENHQYHNAKSLADKNAAVLIEEKNIKAEFTKTVDALINNNDELNKIKTNCKQLGKADAAEIIALNAIKYAEEL